MEEERREFRPADKSGGSDLRIYGKEAAAAVMIVLLVIAVAFGVNKFFYGFDRQQNAAVSPGQVVSGTDSSARNRKDAYRQSDDWRLVLVNRDYPLTEDFDGELTELRNGEMVDSRIYPDLQDMFDEMREDGLSPCVVQGYRTGEEQSDLHEEKIEEYMEHGKSREEAAKLAAEWVQEPGTSEHEIGICVDISSETGGNESAEEIWDWLDANCARFGFIKRFPTGKWSVTGVKGGHWHYRYVGQEAAQEITERGLTLEEYLGAVTK